MRNIGVRSTRSIRLFLDIRHITGTSVNKGMLMMVIHSCDSANAVKSAYFWSSPYFYKVDSCTLWLFNIAMDNGPFIDDFPIKTSIYKGLSMAMLNNQMVLLFFQQCLMTPSSGHFFHGPSMSIHPTRIIPLRNWWTIQRVSHVSLSPRISWAIPFRSSLAKFTYSPVTISMALSENRIPMDTPTFWRL